MRQRIAFGVDSELRQQGDAMDHGHPVRQRAKPAQLSTKNRFSKGCSRCALKRTGCPRSDLGLEDNAPITFAPRHPLAVEILKQGNRILSRDAGQILESSDVDRLVLCAKLTHPSGQIVQRRPVKKHLPMNLNQQARINQ